MQLLHSVSCLDAYKYNLSLITFIINGNIKVIYIRLILFIVWCEMKLVIINYYYILKHYSKL